MSLHSNSNKSENKLYILKIRTQDPERKQVPVHFEVFEKKTVEVEGKTQDTWVTATTTKDVSGDLTRIELGEREYQGEKTPTVKITLVDSAQKECYLLDLRYNMVSRSLFNSLFSLNSFNNLEIGVYQTKPKTEDGKSFASVSLKQAGNRVDWKFKKEEIPPVEIIKAGKNKEISNFDNMNEFFLKNLEELAKKLRSVKSPVKVKTEIPVNDSLPDGPDPEPSGEEKLF